MEWTKSNQVRMSLVGVMAVLAAGCAPQSSTNSSSTQIAAEAVGGAEVTPMTKAAFKVNLTDSGRPEAERTSYEQVNVRIKLVELWLKNEGRGARLLVSQNTGLVNLKNLSGLPLNLSNIQIDEGIEVHKIRLVLEDDGHFMVNASGDICELKTPGASKSGLKVHLTEPLILSRETNYSMQIDLDVKKSTVQTGAGFCILKPVLRQARVTSAPMESSDSDNDEAQSEDSGSSSDQPTDDGSGSAGGSSGADSQSGGSSSDGSTGDGSVTETDDSSDLEDFPIVIIEEGFGGSF